MSDNAPEQNHQQKHPLSSSGKWIVVALALFLSNLPYLYAFVKREDRIYLGIGFNFDDVCVYLSWIKQASGATPFRVYNLFTTQPQSGMPVNPLFLLLGLFSRITTLSPILTFHLSRIVFGGLLFWRLGKLIKTLDIPTRSHTLIFALVAFSSGLGWFPGLWERDGIASPIDRWQPEAITFLSLLLNPLFLASLCLQISTFDFLLRAERGNDKSQIRLSLTAGLLAALLTLIHTYDLISLSLVWTLYLVCRLTAKQNRESNRRLLRITLLAVVFPLPALLWMISVLRSDALFAARVGVETLSPSPLWILLGYGGVFLLALYALLNFAKSAKDSHPDDQFSGDFTETSDSPPFNSPLRNSILFLGVWAIGQLIASYLPVSFQRKMIQGEHLPLAILAGVALPLLWNRLAGKTKRILPVFATLSVTLLSLSNLRFLLREMSNSDNNLVQTGQHRAYLSEPEWKTIEWLRTNAKPGESLQALPWLTLVSDASSERRYLGVKDMTLPLLIPALTGLPAYCAHFGETPNFGEKLSQLTGFTSGKMPLSSRLVFKKEMNTTYLLFTQTPTISAGDLEIATSAETAFRETTSGDQQEFIVSQITLAKTVR